MNVNEKDPTKVNDGNELGVYMSTNKNMVDYAYSEDGSVKNNHIETPVHLDEYGQRMKYIKLPSCGVIIEVDTANLPIRKPEITSYLQGVYNNGAVGDEWIADKIPPSDYKVMQLILNAGLHPQDKIKVDIDFSDKNSLKNAIDFIKTKFSEIKEEALLYKKFLESLSDQDRLRTYPYLKKKWEEYKAGINQ
ncbi:MAG: hypothetical protein NTZ97_00295 [Candidatus Moranbacteria bacterium]|nr:hypothetical protein [Candidatus Moranbacteria bacterium]